ncbi:hypothetical protein RRG08_040888 [Elysia crispata]|uniref:Uncharacterized protein n=1 Tax=Elysia crispata TaxID=231223 RepID=A0AAE1E738_9GAST|nr:hypothetical protein RRG08_040888 [Elysia crispata]
MYREKLRCHPGKCPQTFHVEPAGLKFTHHAAPPTTLAGYCTTGSDEQGNTSIAATSDLRPSTCDHRFTQTRARGISHGSERLQMAVGDVTCSPE